MKKINLIIALTVLIGGSMFSQQDAMYTHYSFNTLGVNPGYAGSRGTTTLTALHRSQWVGFEGAPTTQTFTLHSPVFHNSLGMGLSVINDKIGPTNMTSFYGDIAYRIKLSTDVRLALGVKGGGNLFQGDLNGLQTKVPDQQLTSISSKFLPNFGLGAYLSHTNWYVGFSVPKLLKNSITANANGSIGAEQLHYFAIAGFATKLSRTVVLKPTGFLKVTEAAPIEGDITAMFIFNRKLELGAMYRTGDAVGALIGYNFNSQLRIGYSFDWSMANTTATYNAGSHEVMLRYDIFTIVKENIHSPRYF